MEPPLDLRFVRSGRGERWRDANLTRQQIHFGWSKIPHGALKRMDSAELKRLILDEYATKPYKSDSARRTAASNSLRELLDALEPQKFTWITIADDKLWWCTARPGVTFQTESKTEGHFFATCDRPWTDRSLAGLALELKLLPKSASVVSRYQGTVCKPKQSESIWRVIKGEVDPAVTAFQQARENYQAALRMMIERLHPRELEDLVDLLFARAGWSRLARVGGTEKDWDLQTEHPELAERAAVQVKVTAGQSSLADYERRYVNDGRFQRLFFVVALPQSKLTPRKAVIWTSTELAQLVERRGLAEWLAGRG